MKEDTLDWFAAVTLNPDKDYAHFSVRGYDDTNTIMLTPEEYKKSSQVQEIFSDKNGNFNDALFNQKYNEALKTYNVFVSGNIQNKHFRKHTGTIYNPSAEKVVNPSLRVKMVDNPFDTSYGLVGFDKESKPIESAREIAQRSKVYDSETKQVLNYTPNNFFSSMFGESLIEARWDKSGTHIDSWGNEVSHNKGDWKLIDGKPYYETLGNQDSTGKNFLHWTDVVTDDGSMMNSIDFLDSDGLEKSITGQTVKTALTIGALFVPYLGETLLLAGTIHGLSDIASTLTKAAIETSDDYANSNVWKFANSMDGFFSRFDRSQSDESAEKTWGYENMTNLIDETFDQIKQQKWIAKSISKVPSLFGKSEQAVVDKFVAKNKDLTLDKFGKTLENAIKDGDVSKSFKEMNSLFGNLDEFKSLAKSNIRATKLGMELGSNYMALLQTKDVYENLKQNNFDSNTVLIGTVASALGFMGIMKTDLAKIAYRGFEPSEVQKALSPVITDAIKETAEAAGVNIKKELTTEAGKMKFLKNAYNNIIKNVKSLWDAKGEFGIKGYISDMLKEGTEEVTEEVLQDAIMSGAKYYEEGIKSLSGYKSKNTYSFANSNPFDRYAMSFFGGALGGGVFKASDHIEHLKNYDKTRDAKCAETASEDMMSKLVGSLVMFDVEKVEKEINKQLDDGIISDKLSTEMTDDSTPDNIVFKPATSTNMSQREVIRTNLIGFVRGVDAYLTKENLKVNKNDVVNKALAKLSIANKLSNNFTNLIYTDYITEASAKTKLSLQLNAMEDGEAKNKLQQQIDIHSKNINDIMSGANAGEYAEKIAFVNNPDLLSAFIAPTVEIYSKSQFGKNYNKLSDSERNIIDESYKKYTTSVTNNLDVVKAYKMFKMFKETFQGKIEEFSNTDFINSYKAIQEIIKPEINLSKEEMNNLVNLFKGELTNDEFIAKHNLNETDIAFTDEEKEKIVKESIENAIKANPQLIDTALDNSKDYDMSLGSNYLFNPYNKGKAADIVNRIEEIIKNKKTLNGETTNNTSVVDKYTFDMLKSYLDGIDDDLNTNKTTIDILKRLIQKGKTYSGEFIDENDPVSEIIAYYLNNSGIGEISSDDILSNRRVIEDIADFISNNLDLSESIGNNFKEVKDLKDLKTKIESILKSEGGKSVNDPLYDILSTISEELYGKDLFKLLKDEDSNFKSSKVLDSYVIRDMLNMEELEGMLHVIDIFKAITSNVHSDANYTKAINSYREKHSLKPYKEFTFSESEVLNKALSNISVQIKFLISLSNKNNSGKILTDKKTWFETQKYLLLKLKEFVEENNLGEDLTGLDVIADVEFSENNLTLLNKVVKDFEVAIYEWFQQIPDKSVVFEGENPIMKLKKGSNLSDKTTLLKNPSELGYSDLFFKQWLLSNIILDPRDFNKKYQQFLQQDDVKAPFYSQMLNVKMICAFIEDSDNYFNKFGEINEVNKDEFVKNVIYIDASAGSGKSTMIASFIWNYLQTTDKVNWLASNTENNIKTVLKNIKDINPENVKTKDQLFSTILTSEEYKVYEELKYLCEEKLKNSKNKTFYNKKYDELLTKINRKEGLPNNILYDEAGDISALERDIISKLGIKLIAMGDLTQDGYMINGITYDIDVDKQLLKTPKLPSGIRFDNINKRLSTLMLLECAEELNSLLEELQDVPESITKNKYEKLLRLIEQKEFKYYQTEDELLGDKIVNRDEIIVNDILTKEYEVLIKNLIAKGKTVTYISDESNLMLETYLSKELGVTISPDTTKGQQFDYTIVNVQFSNKKDDYLSYISTFKHFNTLATRSISGNIMINNNLPIYRSSRVYSKPVDIALTDEDVQSYKSFWLDSYFNDEDVKKEVKQYEPVISQEEEVTTIEDFKDVNRKDSASNKRYNEILDTENKAINLVDPTIKDKEEKQNEINKKLSEILATDGGYVVLNNMFKDRTPYNEDGSVNAEYWLLNLMFFNPNYEDWDILINTYAPNQNVKNVLLNTVNTKKLQDSNIHFSSNGEIRLEYIDNNGKEASIILEQHTIPFKECIIPFKDLIVESNKVTFDRSSKIRKSHSELENNFESKIKISPVLYAGKINGNEAVYSFATYNLWNNEHNLGNSYINNKEGHSSPIAVNPIGRNFSEFVSEWKEAKGVALIDRLCGINQSYRLIKALVDYDGDDAYKDELNLLLNDIKQDVDFSLDLNINNDGKNVTIGSKVGKVDVLTNIFNGESNISLFAKNNKLFNEVNSYLKENQKITFEQLTQLFTKIKMVLDGKSELESIPDSFGNIKKELKNLLDIVDPESETLRNVNNLLDNAMYGIELLTENTDENFIKYFSTDLYFSLYHNIKVMNSLVKHLTKTLTDQNVKVYDNLYNVLNKLTDRNENGGTGLFKDGIWYNYVAIKSNRDAEKAKKSGNLYSSYKNINSVYFDNEIKSPTVYFRVGQNQMTNSEVKPSLIKPSTEVKKFTFEELRLLNSEMLDKVNDETLIGLVGSKIDINSEQDKNLYDFLTSKIIKSAEEFVTLQLDENNKLILSKNIKDTVTNFIKNEGGILGQDGRLYKENAIYKVVPRKGVVFFKYTLDNNFKFMKKDLDELDAISKDWDTYKDLYGDVDKDSFISSTRVILQSLSDEVKLEIKNNLEDFRNNKYNINEFKINDNQRAVIADIIDINDEYNCKNI